MNAWGSVQRAGKEERNNILQKAITLFIAEIKGLKLESSKISFMAVKEKGSRDNERRDILHTCFSLYVIIIVWTVTRWFMGALPSSCRRTPSTPFLPTKSGSS
jgi:hypothetical protein